jgi:HSP20 family protein
MGLTRWQPLREMVTLREAMDRLFEENFLHPFSGGGSTVVPMDMVERDNEVVVRAAVPGFDPEQIEISIQGDTLTIRGQMEADREDQNENYHLREYRAGNFQRAIRLPLHVNPDQATAECKNGILTLRLPKAEVQQPKRIQIQGSDEPQQIEATEQTEKHQQGEQSE